jgi:hypothetical protein
VPLALTQFVKHNRVLHQRVLLATVVIEEAPRIADEARAEVIEVIEGITRVILHFGFMQYPTIAEGLRLASSQGKLPGIDLATSPITSVARPSFPAGTFPGCGCGGKRCLLFCSAMPSAQRRFLGCRRGRSSNSGLRSRFRDAPRQPHPEVPREARRLEGGATTIYPALRDGPGSRDWPNSPDNRVMCADFCFTQSRFGCS